MSRPAHAVSIEVDVPFHACDPLGIAWHGRYFEYLEAARQALLRAHRLDVPDLRAMGHRLYVADARCRYMFPLTYRDKAVVTAWFAPDELWMRVAYDVHNATQGRRCARAHTVLAITDCDGKLLAGIPRAVQERLPEGA